MVRTVTSLLSCVTVMFMVGSMLSSTSNETDGVNMTAQWPVADLPLWALKRLLTRDTEDMNMTS